MGPPEADPVHRPRDLPRAQPAVVRHRHGRRHHREPVVVLANARHRDRRRDHGHRPPRRPRRVRHGLGAATGRPLPSAPPLTRPGGAMRGREWLTPSPETGRHRGTGPSLIAAEPCAECRRSRALGVSVIPVVFGPFSLRFGVNPTSSLTLCCSTYCRRRGPGVASPTSRYSGASRPRRIRDVPSCLWPLPVCRRYAADRHCSRFLDGLGRPRVLNLTVDETSRGGLVLVAAPAVRRAAGCHGQDRAAPRRRRTRAPAKSTGGRDQPRCHRYQPSHPKC